MGVAVVNQLPEEAWRQFVAKHPLSNIYHTPEMFQVFARVPGHQPTVWAAVGDGDRVLALLLPVNITLMNGLLRKYTSRAVCYGGVLCAPGTDGQAALAQLLNVYKQEAKRSALFTELRNLSDLADVQPVLNECGFRFEGHLNYLIDLVQSEGSLLHNISKSGRQSIRTSCNKGTMIEEMTDRRTVAVAYQLLRKVYARARVPLAAPTLFEAALDVLAPQGMFKVFLARAGDHYIGACLILAYKDRIIDWYAGSDRAFSAYCPMELLIWRVLKWGQAHGFRVFDFGGAGRPGEHYGPGKFKAKFGGGLVNFGRNTAIHALLRLQLSQVGYGLYRRFLSHE